MSKRDYIAAISSYGTVSNPQKRYVGAIMYSDKEKMLEALRDFLPTQVLLAKVNPEYKEDLDGEVDSAVAFSQIKEGIMDLSEQYDTVMSAEYQESNAEKRLVISIPEILTDYHIEILPVSDEEFPWLLESNQIGVMADSGMEGCGGDGEFFSVCQICDPKEEVEEYYGFKEPSALEEWNNLIGEGSIVPLIKA